MFKQKKKESKMLPLYAYRYAKEYSSKTPNQFAFLCLFS